MYKKNISHRQHKNKLNKIRIILSTAITCILIAAGIFTPGYAKRTQQNTKTKFKIETNPLLTVKQPQGAQGHIINYPGFNISFSRIMHQPYYAAWELTRSETMGKLPRYTQFHQDKKVRGCPTAADYKNSGFQRGHMAPAGDFKWDVQAMKATFYLTNICPQKAELNTGAWNRLEQKCRDWAQRDSALIIICGPILTDRMTQTIGKSKIPVPQRFFKVILAPYTNPPRAIGFIMNNGKVEGGLQKAACSVDQVERITGYDFFTALPDNIEKQVEANSNFNSFDRPPGTSKRRK